MLNVIVLRCKNRDPRVRKKALTCSYNPEFNNWLWLLSIFIFGLDAVTHLCGFVAFFCFWLCNDTWERESPEVIKFLSSRSIVHKTWEDLWCQISKLILLLTSNYLVHAQRAARLPTAQPPSEINSSQTWNMRWEAAATPIKRRETRENVNRNKK